MSKKDQGIVGMATLDSQLFIVRLGSQQIDIYNTTDFTETGHVTVKDMKLPFSLVACSHYNCLYVSDDTDPYYIHRVELSDKFVTKWKLQGSPYSISVTRAHNVIVTLYYDSVLQEYTTQGELMRDISFDDNKERPCHSIQLF